jgi:putative transcriptional regulator
MRNSLPVRRSELAWSQEELAKRVGVSRQTIVAIEKGRYDPRLTLAFRLAEAFGCRVDDLFER